MAHILHRQPPHVAGPVHANDSVAGLNQRLRQPADAATKVQDHPLLCQVRQDPPNNVRRLSRPPFLRCHPRLWRQDDVLGFGLAADIEDGGVVCEGHAILIIAVVAAAAGNTIVKSCAVATLSAPKSSTATAGFV